MALRLWLVRHGQSAGNVAADAALAAGEHLIGLEVRDVDVPLSDLGRQQAEAVGRWFALAAGGGAARNPCFPSPYLRARETAEAICRVGGIADCAKGPVIDERLREREFGILDRMTTEGIRALHPTRRSSAACSASSIIARPAARAGSTSFFA
jgi:broad specificity phosphatase PhoE